MNYYMTFDGGTQSTKVALFDDHFRCVAEHSTPNTIRYPRPGWAELSADDYVTAVVEGMAACMQQSGVDPSQVRGICGDGIIMGVVGVNAEGQAITPYLPYLDSRAKAETERVQAAEQIWVHESGNAVIESLQPPIMAAWLVNNDEAFGRHGAKFVNNGPYIAGRLAGLTADELFIDHATLGGWIIGYKAETKEWSPEQLDLIGLPARYLPRIVAPTEIVGHLTAEMAERTGLKAGTPIVAGAGDTMQSFLGCGVFDVGAASDVAGTAAMFGIMTDGIRKDLSESSGMYFSIASVPNTYFYWGYIRTGGLSLQWFRDRIMNRPGDKSFYDEANELAAAEPPGANGTVFFPYLQGGSGFNPHASGCFLNMTSGTALGEMWRAILESIGYEYMSLAAKLRAGGADIGEVVVTEGGSHSDVWNQIKADMLGVRVKTMKKKEGATMSNAVLAAAALGDVDDLKGALRGVLVEDKVFDPIPSHHRFYQEAYERYQKILQFDMATVFAACSELRCLSCEDTVVEQLGTLSAPENFQIESADAETPAS